MPPSCKRCWNLEIDHRVERDIETLQPLRCRLSFCVHERPLKIGYSGFDVLEDIIYDRDRKVDVVRHAINSSTQICQTGITTDNNGRRTSPQLLCQLDVVVWYLRPLCGCT